MKFNPISKNLYTDEGAFIKRLHCPYGIGWNQLSTSENGNGRACSLCKKSVEDTSYMTDNMALTCGKDFPDTCFRVNIESDNVTVVTFDD